MLVCLASSSSTFGSSSVSVALLTSFVLYLLGKASNVFFSFLSDHHSLFKQFYVCIFQSSVPFFFQFFIFIFNFLLFNRNMSAMF